MILITGGNGYVASYTIEQLKKSSSETIRVLVRKAAHSEKLQQRGIQAVVGDVTDLASLKHACTGVDKIIHLAAVNRDKGNVTMQRVNAEGTINVVEAAKAAGVKHIITVVGLGADAKRPYPLASTQGVGVDSIINSGIPYTILEASVIFGAGDEFLNTLAGLARIPPVMVVPGDGQSRFQPIAAQDVAACAVKALHLPAALNQRLQICGAEVLTLEQIIDAILAEMQLKRIKIKMPVPILKIAVGLMDKTLPKPPVTPSLLAQLGVDNVATNNSTERIFGVTPIKLTEGIGFVKQMTLGKLIRRTLNK
ncbi:MAG: NAD(P)H-binding protein [Anaerolineae bacterium]|nr:NAD(P)H-binding protein [Anaerolineae bacterium]